MNSYPIEKLVNVALSYKNLNKMSNFATAKAGKDVRVLDNPGNSCYSSHDYWTGLNIQLGRTFYQSAFNDDADVSVADVRQKYVKVASVMFGAYYHELFHVLYTPFQYCMTLTSNCNEAFRSFAHQISNILEDITIEGTGCNRYPFAQKYIDILATCFKQEEQLKMVTKAITDEPTSPGTMLAYLLHYCRGTDMSQFPKYQLWEDNKEFIEWGAYKCINTIDPYLRVRRQMAYALELCKILEMKEPSKDNMESPDMSNLGEASKGLGGDGGTSGSGKQAISPMKNLSDTSSQGPRKAEPQETDDDINMPDEECELKEMKAERGDGSKPNEESPVNADLTQQGITMLANNDPVSRYSHYADRLNKYIKTEDQLPAYDKIVRQQEKQIRTVVGHIRKLLVLNRAGWQHYTMSGKIDMSTIYKKDNYKIFKKAIAPKETADLVFEILVDNSGSMHGNKAKLAGRALIVFCEALNRLHIPFSVDAFTEGGAAITISLKGYDETYERTKTNMTLFTEQFNCNNLDTWSGNIDEINLKYVSSELALRKERDKFLIVISDGATCGSKNELKQIAENIEKSGITVLGIGIFDHNVEDIYSKHIVLQTQDDLEKLGDFLNKYLIGKIFK